VYAPVHAIRGLLVLSSRLDKGTKMNISNLEWARVIRDSGMDAMDALNEILEEIGDQMPPEEQRSIRRAIALTMDSVLVNIVNPMLNDHPELEEDETKWGEIALARARKRCSRPRNTD
jgi:hypothetical protein